MTCAIWSLGQIPASLTVHWLKGIAVSLKSDCQLANELKITGVSFYRSLCSEPSLYTPHRAEFAASNHYTLLLTHCYCFATGNGSGLSRRISTCEIQIQKQRGKWNLCTAKSYGHSAGSWGRDLLEEDLNVVAGGQNKTSALRAGVTWTSREKRCPAGWLLSNQHCHLFRFWMGMWGEQGQSLGEPTQGLGLGQRVWYIFIFLVPFAGGRPFSFLFHF